MTPSDPLLRFRPEFPILATTTYRISNSLGVGIRMSPHLYTTDEIRASSGWERRRNRASIVK